jgi:alcohol dehydrogenase (cytochrome c)
VRIEHAQQEPGNWLTYSGNYQGHRYSGLDQIDVTNVSLLKPAWIYQINDLNQFEVTPLVVDGILYISEPPSNAAAIDARTGRLLWFYRRTFQPDIHVCCGQVNRGLAVKGDTIYLGTIDAHLVALDARTGRLRWDVVVADYQTGHSITAAPLVIKDKVLVGISGGEYGIRGFLDAYDAESGKRVWRFWTVPGPGEPGHGTWAGESWRTGGAPTWVTGSYDPQLNLVYWGTGNPGPNYNGDGRQGDNLYANSLLAIEADTGKLKWHFQFTPHDVHDWDSNHVPVLADTTIHGSQRKIVAMANRNSFYYVLDRLNGEFLVGVPYAQQTWASGLDDRGRPILLPGKSPSAEGTMVYPGLHGGTNWFSPSYSPKTGLFYVAAREEATSFYAGVPDYHPGVFFTAGGFRGIRGLEPWGAVRALELSTGKKVWEFPLHSPPWAGLLSTAGGLLFGGTSEGYIIALDATNGHPLWRFAAGGPVQANPISFLYQGKQFVAVAAGHALFAFTE